MEVVRPRVVAHHVAEHVLIDAGHDLVDRERRPRGIAGGHTGDRRAGRRVIQRLVLVDFLGVGGHVVVDVRRIPRDGGRSGVLEGRSGGVLRGRR